MNIRRLFGNLIGFFLLILKPNLKDNEILSIYFHNPTKKVFSDSISYLKKQGYTFLSLNDLLKILDGKKTNPKRAVFISLDDAWRDNLTNVVPIAESENIPIVIFVPVQDVQDGILWLKYFRKASKDDYDEFGLSDYYKKEKEIPNEKRLAVFPLLKEKYRMDRQLMNFEDIKRMLKKNRVVSIGSHTLTHPILPLCNKDDLKNELEGSRKQLEEIFNVKITSVAYPNGDFNKKTLTVTKEANYKIGFCVKQRFLNIDKDNKLALARICVPDNLGKYESRARMLGLWARIF